MQLIRLGSILQAVVSDALFIGNVHAVSELQSSPVSAPMDRRLHSETDLTISIFSSVIGRHMFAESQNA
jgi:hypothetical protein